MSLRAELSPTVLNENGTPRVNWIFDGTDNPDGGIIITGPATGEVVLSDGTRYDVTPEVIEHRAGHAEELAERIQALSEAK